MRVEGLSMPVGNLQSLAHKVYLQMLRLLGISMKFPIPVCMNACMCAERHRDIHKSMYII